MGLLWESDLGPSWTPPTFWACVRRPAKWKVANKTWPVEKEPNVEFGHPPDAPCVKYDYGQVFGHDSIFEKMLDFGLVPRRDPVWSCVWTKRERSSVGSHRQFWLRQNGAVECVTSR